MNRVSKRHIAASFMLLAAHCFGETPSRETTAPLPRIGAGVYNIARVEDKLPQKVKEDRAAPRITVYVYNYAKVPITKLEEARREVMLIYREAGVEAEWVDCPCAAEEVNTYPDCLPGRLSKDWVAIRIVSQLMIDRWRHSSSTFGVALYSEDGEFGRFASVCAECAEQVVKVEPRRYGPLLGNLIAHETGHLLLATLRHSSFGVMRASWNQADLEDCGRLRMFFSGEEARRIRDQVRERGRAQETVNAASLHSPK